MFVGPEIQNLWQKAADAFEEALKSLVKLTEFDFSNPYYSRIKMQYPEVLNSLGKEKEANRVAQIFLVRFVHNNRISSSL